MSNVNESYMTKQQCEEYYKGEHHSKEWDDLSEDEKEELRLLLSRHVRFVGDNRN